MRWVRTEAGAKCHIALSRHKGHTLCGIPLAVATGIVAQAPAEWRCLACDHEWRERGRRERPKAPPPSHTEYNPRFTFVHWEMMP